MKSSVALADSAFLIALFFAGCGDYSNIQLQQDLEFISAVPSKQVMKLRVADSEPRVIGNSEQSLKVKHDPLLGQLAEYYVSSLEVTTGINNGVLGFLDVVDQIVRLFPPVLREENRRVWGPWPSDDFPGVDVRFSMLKSAPGKFGIFYQLRAAEDAEVEGFDVGWTDCVYGQVNPHELIRRGTGTLVVDLQACSEVDRFAGRGKATVVFDTTSDSENKEGKTELEIDFQDFLGRDGLENGNEPLTANYYYLERTDKSGKFDFRTWNNINARNKPQFDALEQLDWAVRWNDDGCGRTDLRISGGDLGNIKVVASECWNSEHKRVYFSNPFAQDPDPAEEGTESDCCLAASSFGD